MGRNLRKTDKKDASSEPGECTQDADHTVSDIANELDPALAKALNVMTANIKVIDENLGGETAIKRLDEAEARILAAENSATAQDPRIIELEKQVSVLSERLDMAENYSRRLNVQ
ncbi:hypothetical protein ABVT39_017492, partial [Epinephelus coioides]